MFSFLHRPIVSLHKTSKYSQEPWVLSLCCMISFFFYSQKPVAADLHFINHQGPSQQDTTSYDVDIRLDLGRDVRWPKFNVKPTSNDNVKLTSKTDVIWRWYLVVFRLCCKVTKIQRRTNVSSQRHIDVKYWYLVVRCGNQNPTSARRHNGNVNTTSNSNIIWRWYLVVFRLCCKVTKIQRRTNVSSQRHIDVKYWYLVVRCGNQNPTSARRHNGNVNTTSNSNIIWRWSLVSFRLWH